MVKNQYHYNLTTDTGYNNCVLEESPRATRLKYTQTLIYVDFEFPKVKFVDHVYIENDSSSKGRLFNLTEVSELSKTLNLATQWTNHEISSPLDGIFTNEELLNEQPLIRSPLDKSNYAVTAFDFINKYEVEHATNNRCWNYKRLDVSALQVNLRQVVWEAHPKPTADTHWDFLMHTILCAT